MDSQAEQDLRILEEIELDPDLTQADLATRLGVAVGTINWYLKRLINKGHVKVRKMQRRRLRYLITPQGIAAKTELTASFMRASMKLYRETRAVVQHHLAEAGRAGHTSVYIDGEGELAEICYLTCLEQSYRAVKTPDPRIPTLRIDGRKIELELPGHSPAGSASDDRQEW